MVNSRTTMTIQISWLDFHGSDRVIFRVRFVTRSKQGQMRGWTLPSVLSCWYMYNGKSALVLLLPKTEVRVHDISLVSFVPETISYQGCQKLCFVRIPFVIYKFCARVVFACSFIKKCCGICKQELGQSAEGSRSSGGTGFFLCPNWSFPFSKSIIILWCHS